MAPLVPQSLTRPDKVAFESYVREYARGGRIRILEAGCGRRWPLSLDSIDFELVGVDINPEALRLRLEKLKDLDQAIVADLRSVELDEGSFDVVYCSFLLEHIEGAEKVLDRLFAALKPGGLLLLRVPDRDGVYGWLARHTPYRTHVWYKRYVRGSKRAGTPGHGPFPVVYDRVLSWRGLQDYCAAHGYTIVEATSWNGHMDLVPDRIRPVVERLFKAVAALSFGRLSADHANLSLVVRR
jgi:SAM-dependent methyltransferase